MIEASEETWGSSRRSSSAAEGSAASGTSSTRENPAGSRPSPSSSSGARNQTIRFRCSRRGSASRRTPR